MARRDYARAIVDHRLQTLTVGRPRARRGRHERLHPTCRKPDLAVMVAEVSLVLAGGVALDAYQPSPTSNFMCTRRFAGGPYTMTSLAAFAPP